jgi:uncharacterized MAPEG superfamily protein
MGAAGRAFSTAYLFSSRDAELAPEGPIWGRATRALANYVENLVAFAAVDLGLIVTHRTANSRTAANRTLPVAARNRPSERQVGWIAAVARFRF